VQLQLPAERDARLAAAPGGLQRHRALLAPQLARGAAARHAARARLQRQHRALRAPVGPHRREAPPGGLDARGRARLAPPLRLAPRQQPARRRLDPHHRLALRQEGAPLQRAAQVLLHRDRRRHQRLRAQLEQQRVVGRPAGWGSGGVGWG
jgi:hypothetical protein